MNKILVEIYVPAVGKSFDVFLPLTSSMNEVLQLVSNSLAQLSDGKFKPTESTVLCDFDSGSIFDINVTVAELRIENGAKLMLV